MGVILRFFLGFSWYITHFPTEPLTIPSPSAYVCRDCAWNDSCTCTMTMRPKWKMGWEIRLGEGQLGTMQRGKLIAIVELIGRRHTHSYTHI